ncbi:DNA-binding transcriptional regulator, FadR family [Actinacidiphila yanglinensis]|uniref:DNA-binding transcriptional regulator, FadR family n=1 Tax=Actinacidiphila yanglinensis TaxID=310779 RepID=A0A1H6AZ89_9ACTN|nr:GntR family transcriptional regulator [Actinacidiphila yanglinensis]SEG53888.1 DNA-binding transcriptional regulator, FadR family [Actinacidiphila yanglinensis]
MALGSLRPSPLVEQAAERLREQITGGQWPVGTKLPGETTLATLLGVGRSTVREALRALAGAGMVRTRQGAGVFVIATRPVEDWPARLRRAALVDVYEVRAMLEVQAARLAAVRRTPEDVEALRAALALRTAAGARTASGPEQAAAGSAGGAGEEDAGAGGDATADGEGAHGTYGASGAAFIDADIALHTAVVAAAHNPVLTDLFAEFAPALRENLLALLDLIDVRAHDEEHGEAAHTALVEAIAAGEPDPAARVLLAELSATQEHLRDRQVQEERDPS